MHIGFQHGNTFPRRICPIPKCRNRKHGITWFSALQHILRDHPKYLLDDVISNIDARELRTDIPCWNVNGSYKCEYDGCDKWYSEEEVLKRHEAFEHLVALLCPFGFECQQSTIKYFGFSKLVRHIILKHAPLFSQPTCFDSECKFGEEKVFKSWPHVLRHILERHLDAVGLITELTTNEYYAYKKCSYDNCTELLRTREEFQYHLVTWHPYPLRCPYNSECNKVVGNNGKGYVGLMKLERHIRANHPVQFQERMCFDSECQKEKRFPNWNALVDHILGKKHWLDIQLN